MVSLKKARVLIVHSQPVMRYGLVALIRSSKHFEVCAETGEAPAARRLFAEHRPDLVVLNLTLRHGDGIALIKDFRKLNRAARALVVTARNDTLSLERVFKAGACGYVVTQDETAEVLHALERIASGELYASGTVSRGLLEMLAAGAVETRKADARQLSDRELQVFRLIGSGLGTSRVATELQVSVKTVETHQSHIKQKLGLHTGVELNQRAARWLLNATRHEQRIRD